MAGRLRRRGDGRRAVRSASRRLRRVRRVRRARRPTANYPRHRAGTDHHPRRRRPPHPLPDPGPHQAPRGPRARARRGRRHPGRGPAGAGRGAAGQRDRGGARRAAVGGRGQEDRAGAEDARRGLGSGRRGAAQARAHDALPRRRTQRRGARGVPHRRWPPAPSASSRSPSRCIRRASRRSRAPRSCSAAGCRRWSCRPAPTRSGPRPSSPRCRATHRLVGLPAGDHAFKVKKVDPPVLDALVAAVAEWVGELLR